jgi:DNA-directed RNA polymerase specialized sigma24 family protein
MDTVHSYRAERLAATQYEAQRDKVVGFVRRKLGGAAEWLREPDLHASYNLAWAALMQDIAAGDRIDSVVGWLCVTTYRRAVDELRRVDHSRQILVADHSDTGDRWIDSSGVPDLICSRGERGEMPEGVQAPVRRAQCPDRGPVARWNAPH